MRLKEPPPPPSLPVYPHEMLITRCDQTEEWCVRICGGLNESLKCMYLKVAGCGSPEYLNVGGVGVGELQSIPEPHGWHFARESFDLTGDIDRVPFPCVHSHRPTDLRCVYGNKGVKLKTLLSAYDWVKRTPSVTLFSYLNTGVLTANLQISSLIIFSNGTPCCAEILTRVCVLDIFKSEGGHASITPHHNIPIWALNDSRKWRGSEKTHKKHTNKKRKQDDPNINETTYRHLINGTERFLYKVMETEGHRWQGSEDFKYLMLKSIRGHLKRLDRLVKFADAKPREKKGEKDYHASPHEPIPVKWPAKPWKYSFFPLSLVHTFISELKKLNHILLKPATEHHKVHKLYMLIRFSAYMHILD